MTGSGGWPRSVFLAPDLRPFYASTYFPPARRYNMPAFKDVLASLAKAWSEDRQEIDRVGKQVYDYLQPKDQKDEPGNSFSQHTLEAATHLLLTSY